MNTDILARELMSRPVRRVTWKTSVGDAARFMLRWGISGVPVVDEHGQWSGVFTLNDLARHVQDRLAKRPEIDPKAQRTLETHEEIPAGFSFESFEDTPVSELMTPGLYTVFPEATLAEVVHILSTQKIHRVFVVEGSELAGVITTMDVMKWMGRSFRKGRQRRYVAV